MSYIMGGKTLLILCRTGALPPQTHKRTSGIFNLHSHLIVTTGDILTMRIKLSPISSCLIYNLKSPGCNTELL